MSVQVLTDKDEWEGYQDIRKVLYVWGKQRERGGGMGTDYPRVLSCVCV